METRPSNAATKDHASISLRQFLHAVWRVIWTHVRLAFAWPKHAFLSWRIRREGRRLNRVAEHNGTAQRRRDEVSYLDRLHEAAGLSLMSDAELTALGHEELERRYRAAEEVLNDCPVQRG